MISQLNVFLGNEEGRLSAAVRELANAGINMHSLNIAESSEYGILRVICDTPEAACAAMKAAGYQASLTSVLAVSVSNDRGGLAALLEEMDKLNVNIEYGYCFSLSYASAVDILKVKVDGVEEKLAAAGFKIIEPGEVYKVD